MGEIIGTTLNEMLHVYDSDPRDKILKLTFNKDDQRNGYYYRHLEDGVVVYEYKVR